MQYCIVLVALALVVPCTSFQDNDLNGIAYIQQTVADLDLSVRFYGETLGGLVITEWSRRNIQSDDHYYRMFLKEILDARDRRVSPQALGVPDIRSGGIHMVSWDFVLFDNCLVWLIQFTDRNGNLVRYFDQNAGTAKTGYGHMSFVGQGDTNPYQMIQDIMTDELALGYDAAGFISLDNMNSFQERQQYFNDGNIDRFALVQDGGQMIASTRGPTGERIEFGWRNEADVPIFCNYTAVHTILSKYYQFQNNRYEKPRIKTLGLHHVEITVKNITAANEFYSQVIGGKNVRPLGSLKFPLEFGNILLQDDILFARQNNIRLDESFGFVDVLYNNSNSGSVDVSFINFDNYYLELYSFNPRNPADKSRLDRTWSSPAYLNVMQPGFWVKENVSMASYVRRMEREAAARGWTNVKANRAILVSRMGDDVQDNDYSRPEQSGNLQGFDYVFAKGPDGEQFSLAKFTGAAARLLKTKILEYGGVSTAFNETNPWTWNGFKDTCAEAQATEETKEPSGGKGQSSWSCLWYRGMRGFWNCYWGYQ